MKPQQLTEVVAATAQNYDLPPLVTHNMEFGPADQQLLDGTVDKQAFGAVSGPAVRENIWVRVSFLASVYGRNHVTDRYELQRVETARDLGAVSLGMAGVAVASAESYMNLRDQGAMVSAQAAYIAHQTNEMFRLFADLFGTDATTTNGKKKKRKKTDAERTA